MNKNYTDDVYPITYGVIPHSLNDRYNCLEYFTVLAMFLLKQMY